MAHRYTRKKKTAYVFWSQIVAGAVVLFPLSLRDMDFRAVFGRGVSVAAYKSSPAYAAFEDLKENFDDDDSLRIPSGPTVALNSTHETYRPPAEQQYPRQRYIALKGMTVKAPPEALPSVKPEVMIAANTYVRPSMPTLPRATSTIPVNDSSYYMDPRDDMFSVPVAAGSSAKHTFSATQRTIQTASGTPILIARGDVAASTPAVADTRPAADEDADQGRTFVNSLMPVEGDPGNVRPLWLNGQIEMTGGLAFVGPETQILVKRVFNGATQESGRIWVTEGKFEIHVKKAVGYLVAELFTRDGRVLGRGELNLLQLRDIPSNNNRIGDLRLALRPTTDTASIRPTQDYRPSGNSEPLRTAKVEIDAYTDPTGVNDDGYFSENTLDRESTFVARASAPKNWSSLVVGQAGRPQDVRVFSNSLVQALIGLNLEGTDRTEAEQMGIVWGQLTRDGKPVAGAVAEMAGDYKPIYLNDAFLPDKKLNATSKNGLFAFLRVKPGVQAVRVRHDGHMYPAQVFPTENKHVSYLELELRDKIVSQFRVLDVLQADAPVTARVRLVGGDTMLSLAGNQYVEYSVAGSNFMIEADAGDEYELSRTTLSGSPQLVNVPVVKREWLRNLALDAAVNQLPARGTVVGFVDDQDFEVEMTGALAKDQMQIVYFDAKGQISQSRTGVAGGGFAIFNAPPGLQTVFIHPLQSRGSFSQVVVAEPEFVHVIAWPAN